jgi:hypothetical protein
VPSCADAGSTGARVGSTASGTRCATHIPHRHAIHPFEVATILTVSAGGPGTRWAPYGSRMRVPLAAALSAVLIGAGLAVAPSSPRLPAPGAAAAAASSTIDNASIRVSTSVILGAGCSQPAPLDSEQYAVITDGARTVSTSDTGSVVSDTDSTDTTAVAGSARATVRSTLVGDVRRVDLTGVLSATLDAAKGAGTACRTFNQTRVDVGLDLITTRPGWVTLGGNAARYGAIDLGIARPSNLTDYDLHFEKTSGRSSTRFFLQPAGYLVDLDMTVDKDYPIEGVDNGPDRFAASLSAFLQFVPAGGATGPVTGSRARAAALAPALFCGRGSTTLRTSRFAARAGLARVLVNGRQVRVVRNPRAGQAVTLRGLPRQAPVTVVVRAGRFTARRTYEACSARGY